MGWGLNSGCRLDGVGPTLWVSSRRDEIQTLGVVWMGVRLNSGCRLNGMGLNFGCRLDGVESQLWVSFE